MSREWQSILQDFHLALRSFRHAKFLALLTIGTLAVGIGACTAVFSMVDRGNVATRIEPAVSLRHE